MVPPDHLWPDHLCGDRSIGCRRAAKVRTYVVEINVVCLFPKLILLLVRMVFFYRGAVIWNSLSPALFTVNALSNFKSLYKRLYVS